MRSRWFVALLSFVVAVQVSVGADVTIVTTMSIQGAPAGAMDPANPPKMTLRVKGMKMRTDTDAGGMSMGSIADVSAKQMIILNGAEKSARILDASTPAASGAPGVTIPKLNPVIKPTGQKRTIDGVVCDEYSFTMAMEMAAMSGGMQLPPEAAEMMKDVRMLFDGSFWVAKSGPGVDEVVAFTRASLAAGLPSLMAASMPGLSGGMDELMAAAAKLEGVTYLTEMTMRVEGSGQLAEMMRQQQGQGMKMTMKVTSVSTDPIPDSMFAVPDGYKVIK